MIIWEAKTHLLTAHITYRRPDHLWLLQEFIWQDYDAVPEYPKLKSFLTFWRTKLDGPLVEVRVGIVGTRAGIRLPVAVFTVAGTDQTCYS
jgi:uncharacterized protein Usg